MADKKPEELTPEALEERQRVLRCLESVREEFIKAGAEQQFDRLFNCIQFGGDPGDPDYEKDWLIP